jgi:hypothetical protein
MTEKKEFSIKTKNYTHYPDCWWWWWDWALPLRISAEYLTKGYSEIDIQILFWHFTYTRISHEFCTRVDAFIGQKD